MRMKGLRDVIAMHVWGENVMMLVASFGRIRHLVGIWAVGDCSSART